MARISIKKRFHTISDQTAKRITTAIACTMANCLSIENEPKTQLKPEYIIREIENFQPKDDVPPEISFTILIIFNKSPGRINALPKFEAEVLLTVQRIMKEIMSFNDSIFGIIECSMQEGFFKPICIQPAAIISSPQQKKQAHAG